MPYKNLQKAKQQKRDWRKNNPEKVKESSRKYYLKNKVKWAIKSREYYIAHKDRIDEYARLWVLKNPEKVKRYLRKSILKRYNISIEQYDSMFKEQNGLCAICNLPEKASKWSLSVDHNHKNGEVRGLLCRDCNAALGLFKDNVLLLRSSIKYLIKSNTMK